MLNFEPLDGLEKFQSKGVCRCWGLHLRRIRGICECESLLLKISRRVRGQGGPGGGQGEGQNAPEILTFELLAGFKKSKSMGVHGCEGLSQGEIRRIGVQGEGQLPHPKC